MRLGRLLIVASIVLIVAFVGDTYLKRKAMLVKAAPTAPAPLGLGLEARGTRMCHSEYEGDRKKVEVCAEKYRQLSEPSMMELDKVELKIYHKDAAEYDLIESGQAQFDIAGKSLYSDGGVEITMGVKTDGEEPSGRLLKIRSSGVRFASDTGKATTDRPATFEFDAGSGSATGAEYDPSSRELHLRSKVVLHWVGRTPGTAPMEVEAGEAMYYERESKVLLYPWSKLKRDHLRLEAGRSEVILQKGEIDHADVRQAHGVQDDPGRKVEFAADLLGLHFAAAGGHSMLIRHIDGEQHARLVSSSDTARTTVTADHLDMDFDLSTGESTLEKSFASGHSVAETVPLPRPGAEAGDTRILRSDVLRLKMRPGGREMESAETDGPGTLEFIPNREGQPKRTLQGDKIWIAYGAENRIQSFRSINVTTRTDKPPTARQAAPPPALTQSKEILATFDPATGDLARVEQKTNFRYQEGDRQARADDAVLEQQKDLITLNGGARLWDPTGSAAADRIVMNQKSGDYTAEGHVVSTRQPDKDGKSSAMLSTEEVLQARAQRMTSANGNKKIHYEGQAVAWQGANRVEAERLDIDRDKQILEAHGQVVSQFVDKSKDGNARDKGATAGKAAAPVFTVVRAPDLVYHEDTRLAIYQGGATMTRPDLTVAGREIRAYLKDSDSDSSLDKAFADGAVRIDSTRVQPGGPKRTRTGTSEHAEYYAGESKVILEGGPPLLVDSLRGKTTGKQLTWWANNDRLVVDGEESKPARTNVRKK